MHHIFDRIVEARGRRIREELRETFRGCRRRCRRRQMYCQPPYSPPLRHRWSGALLAFQGKFFAEPSETSEAPFWRLLPQHSVAIGFLISLPYFCLTQNFRSSFRFRQKISREFFGTPLSNFFFFTACSKVIIIQVG